MNAPEPLGIFGGTFDPIHTGHLRLAEEARETLGLSAIRWIPAGQPKHRQRPLASPQQRLAMVQLAIADNPHFQLDPAEVESGEASYTVPTLERLRDELGADRPLVLLLGADAFAGLSGWHRWQAIFGLAHLAIAHRPGFSLVNAQAHGTALPPALQAEFNARHIHAAPLNNSPAGHICTFAMTPLDISATQIRHSFAQGRSTRYLLPSPVIDYIESQQLYRNTPCDHPCP